MPATSMKPTVRSLTPMGKRLLVEIIPDPSEVGGIIMPEAQKHISRIRAKITDIGSGVPVHHGLKIGDVIMARRELGYVKVIVNSVEQAIMPLESVLCVESGK